MTYEMILRSYGHLTDNELREELEYRTSHRYSTRGVGADGCMINTYVIQACRELLDSRGTINRG